ncbi:MAG TPA: hypothetical protein PLW44_08630, partial [Chitinophagales bacterium]|nr:hypothetical protein [Chitinophagales bacterium]
AGNTPYWNGSAWVVNSSNIYNNGANVGIGETSPVDKLVVSGNIGQLIAAPYGTVGGQWSTYGNLSGFLSAGDYYGTAYSWTTDGFFVGLKDYGNNRKDAVLNWGDDAPESLRFQFLGTDLMLINSSGNVGIGTTSPSAKLDVNGTTRTTNFQMTNGAVNNYILTSDGSGNATWQPKPASPLAGLTNGLVAIDGGGNVVSTARTITGTTNQIDVTNGNGVSGNPTIAVNAAYAEALKAQTNVTGGGNITYNSSGELRWSNRFIVISNGRGGHFANNGYFDIEIPAVNTVITGAGGAANTTVTAGGIPLGGWQALYYILPVGNNNASLPSNFRVVQHTGSLTIPENWLLLALRSGDDNSLRLGTGITLKLGQTWVSGGGTAQDGGNGVIQNTTTQQSSANFNISGNGVVGTNLSVGTATADARLLVTDGSNPGVYDDTKEIFALSNNGTGQSYDGGFEFRHSSNSQGIGLGYNTIYATGYNTDQDLNLIAKGNSPLTLQAYGGATGNVGIGIGNPGYKLEVNGTARMAGAFTASSTASIGGNTTIGGTTADARLLVQQGGSPGTYEDNKELYVMSDNGTGQSYDGGVEFRHSGHSQGIGFGYNTIYATGYNANQDLNLIAKGSSHLTLQAYGGATGNVGIATGSPAYKLDVNGTARFSGSTIIGSDLTINGNLGLGVTPTQKLDVNGAGLFRNGSIGNQIIFGYGGNAQYQHAIKTRHNSGGQQGNAIDFYAWDQTTDAIGTVGTKHVLTLDGNGNVGVGTTAPTSKLHVVGTANVTTNLTVGGTLAVTGTSSLTGNVGIGTAAGTNKLDVNGGLAVRNGSVGNQFVLSYNGTLDYAHAVKTRHNSGGQQGNAIDFYVWNQGTDAVSTVGTKHVMTLDGNGNVGIGVTNPGSKLEVSGSLKTTTFQMTSGAASNYVLTSDGSGNASWQAPGGVWATNSTHIYNTNTGNVGVGTNSPSEKLFVDNGSIGMVQGSGYGNRDNKWLSVGVPPTISSYPLSQTNTNLYGLTVLNESDGLFVGLRDYGTNRKDALIAFGDDAEDLLRIQFGNSDKIAINYQGYMGFGNTAPKAMVHVTSGDVYIENTGRGVIMKSPNGSCWRMTVTNAGTAQFDAISCP